MTKRLLVPGLFADERTTLDLIAADRGVEVVFGLSADDRALGFGGQRIEERSALVQAALDDHIASVHALHAVGVTGHLPVPRELLERGELLEVVFIQAAGTDRIDVGAATERGIVVINAPGANAPAVAEHAVGLMLALLRHIAESDRRAHLDARWPAVRYAELGMLQGKTLGIVGYGFIGRTIAQICRDGFGMRAIAFDPHHDPIEAERLGVELVPLDSLLAEADVVSLSTPDTPASHGLIDGAALAAMKPTAIVVNTGRGPAIDTEALVDALRAREIAGAGLDVTHPEPLPEGHPLFSFDNVVITGHSAGAGSDVHGRIATTATRFALQALRGERPRHIVNPEAWEQAHR